MRFAFFSQFSRNILKELRYPRDSNSIKGGRSCVSKFVVLVVGMKHSGGTVLFFGTSI